MTALPQRALSAEGLVLRPLVAGDADALFDLLSDPGLYVHLDEAPLASLEALRARYARLEARRSPDGREAWLNWIVLPAGGPAAGYVQVTVTGNTAWIGYVLGRAHWGRGLATCAMRAGRAPGVRPRGAALPGHRRGAHSGLGLSVSRVSRLIAKAEKGVAKGKT